MDVRGGKERGGEGSGCEGRGREGRGRGKERGGGVGIVQGRHAAAVKDDWKKTDLRPLQDGLRCRGPYQTL